MHPMQFLVEYPILSNLDDGAWIDPANIAAFARAVENAGFSGIAFTDHPAPSRKWLNGGGHETFDPFVALGFCAAATSRLRLFTYLAVVPYRNPLLLARSMTSVDVLSGGRATFVLGTGYLRSEFAALGVEFEERNALFDEAIEVLLGVWATDEFSYTGRHFTARGQTIQPGPVQQPHPPLWLGGNARLVRERVARWGQGWAPMLGNAALSRTARTVTIDSEEALATMLEDLRSRLQAHGRDAGGVDIMASAPGTDPGTDSPRDCQAAVGRLADMGVTWCNVPVPRTAQREAIDILVRYGDAVVSKVS
jgi:probable F420-dependent oxidoreductase